MGPSMVTSTIVRALALAGNSWRGQLAVLAVGGIVLGVSTQGASGGDRDLVLQAAVVAIAMLLLAAASVRAASLRHGAVNGELLVDELETIAPMLPRLLVHAGLCVAPVIGCVLLAMGAANLHPLLGLVMVPIVFAVLAATGAPTMLAVVAVLHGEQAWLPRGAVAAVRRAPWRLSSTAIAGTVATLVCALPVTLVGLVVSTAGGWIGTFGSGLVFASTVPGWSCCALALWRDADVDVVASQVESAPVAGQVRPAPSFMAPGQAVAAWVEGPTWDVALEPSAAWGTWIRLESEAQAAFRIAWSGEGAPQLALATEDGTWSLPGDPVESGSVVATVVPAGNTYVRVVARGAVAQALSITMLVAHAEAAA